MERLRNLQSGLGQFCGNLGRRLLMQSPNDLQLMFYVPVSQKNIFGPTANYKTHAQADKLFGASRNKFDVWHCMHQDSTYLPPHARTKLILTIQDLHFMQKYTGMRRAMKHRALQKRINRAQAIVFPTLFTETMVRRHFHLDNQTIHTIPYGNCLDQSGPGIRPKSISDSPFIFSIGVVNPLKNFHVLVPMLSHLKDYSLVIAGNNQSDYANKILQDARFFGVEDRVFLPGNVDEQEKQWLYKNCAAFAFPSLAEGFGLPVIEAMSLGKPTFLSTCTCLPEVGGEEAFYWRDFEPESMAGLFTSGMRKFNNDPAMRQRIIAWSQRFSWNDTALKYLALYREP